MPKAYEGNEPYIFISYAHKDQDEVLRYVDALQSRGFRIWFDGGIQAGTEWPENIARHLRKCACVISFVSESFVESDNCRRELTFSQDLKIDQLSIFIQNLQPQDLPDGIRLQLGLNQAMFRENFDSEEAFVQEIARAPMMQECLGERISDAPLGEEKRPERRKRWFDQLYDRLYQRVGGTDQREKKEHWTRVSKALVWIVVLIELAYIPLSTNIVGYMEAYGYGFFSVCLVLLLVHFFFALFNGSIFAFGCIMARRAGIDQKPLRDAGFYMKLAAVVNIIAPIFTQVQIIMESPIRLSFVQSFPPYFAAVFTAFYLNVFSSCVALALYSLLTEKKKKNQ